jgi:hypothetical protein
MWRAGKERRGEERRGDEARGEGSGGERERRVGLPTPSTAATMIGTIFFSICAARMSW